MKILLVTIFFVIAVVASRSNSQETSLIVWCALDCSDLALRLNASFGTESYSAAAAVTAAYISALPIADAKTTLRPNPYAVFRSTTSGMTKIHGLAEFAYGAWCKKREAENLTWATVGCMFRQEMEAKNYRVDLGDLWEVNEAPQDFHRNVSSRREVATVVGAIARGCDETQQPVPGILFFASEAQSTKDIGEYKGNMKKVLQDAETMSEMEKYVVAFSQEVYTDAKSTCADNATALEQVADVGFFVNHVLSLAAAGAETQAVSPDVLNYLQRAYAPTMNGVWGSDSIDPSNTSHKCHGYGDTNIDMKNMHALLGLQQAAWRQWFDVRSLQLPPFVTFGFGAICSKSDQQQHLSQAFVDIVMMSKNNSLTAKCSVQGASLALQWKSFISW